MKKKKTSRVGTILALALVISTTIIFATNATADKKNLHMKVMFRYPVKKWLSGSRKSLKK